MAVKVTYASLIYGSRSFQVSNVQLNLESRTPRNTPPLVEPIYHYSESLSISENKTVQAITSAHPQESLTISENKTAQAVTSAHPSESLTISEVVHATSHFTVTARSRYAVWTGSPLEISAPSRYTVISQFFKSAMIRYSTKELTISANSRYAVSNHIFCTAINHYQVYPTGVVGADPSQPLVAVSPYHVAITQNIPATDDFIEFKVWNPVDGTYVDLTGIPYQFVVEFQESQPTTWSLSICDMHGQFCPLNQGSVYANLMDERPFGPDGANPDVPRMIKGVLYPTQVAPVIVKQLVVKAKIGGKDYTFTGIGTSWSHSRDWQTRYFNFVWKGTDFSILLNKENQSMQTIRSGAQGITKASTALSQILSTYKVNYDLSRFKDDFTIPVMHRSNGVPHDWVTQILSAMCYEWKMKNGNVFTPYLPVPVPTGTAASYFDQGTGETVSGQSNSYTYDMNSTVPDFVYDFSKMKVYNESYEGSMMALYNRVIAIRAAEGNTSPAYSVDCFEFNDSYSQTFSPPLSFITYTPIAQNNGFFSNFKFYRGTELIAVRDITSGSLTYGASAADSGVIINCTSVKWTWGVLPGGFVGTGAPGRIEFHGTAQVEASVWGGTQYGTAVDQGPDNPAPEMRVFSENLALINKYGLRPIEIPASPLLPTKALLQVFANRMLYRLGRQPRKGTYKVPLNPAIEQGTIIREKDISLGPSFGTPLIRDRVVTGGTHSFSNVPSERYTVYYGNEYASIT